MGSRPLLLDLFCGAGGASAGYHRAGFDVVGVDVVDQPRYPFRFVRADALVFPLAGFDAVHASPPCQAFSRARSLQGRDHPDLITPMRARLAGGVPFVIENVPGAPLVAPIELCSASFGLATDRHRLFETSFPVPLVPPCARGQLRAEPEHVHHTRKSASQRGQRRVLGVQVFGHNARVESARRALGIAWMTRDELSQAIPPVFTEFLGGELMAAL